MQLIKLREQICHGCPGRRHAAGTTVSGKWGQLMRRVIHDPHQSLMGRKLRARNPEVGLLEVGLHAVLGRETQALHRELVTDEVNGLVVPLGDVDALREAIALPLVPWT